MRIEEIEYCPNCGIYLPLGTKKCLACGYPIRVTKAKDDMDVIETSPLGDNTYTVYVDGLPIQHFSVGEKENVLDLDNPHIKVSWAGTTRDATIVHKMYQPIECAGRDMTGRLYKNESMEVILRIELQ